MENHPNILLIDSGSTKTHWCMMHAGVVRLSWHSPGINPYFQEASEIIQTARPSLPPQLTTEPPGLIYYYGAGVSTSENQARIHSFLKSIFPETSLHIHNDLLAAARSTSAQTPGLIGILGTGSNLCIYDGNTITQSAQSLGFLLGDEGSGAVIGQHLLTAYFRQKMPTTLAKLFQKQHPTHLPEVLQSLYRQPYPNRTLASYARFCLQHLSDPWCHHLIKTQFHAFFDHYLPSEARHQKLPLHFVGSIAFHGRMVLEEVAVERGISLGQVVDSPMNGLVAYHQAV